MAAASVVILSAGAGASFSTDELYYFGRVVGVNGDLEPYGSVTLHYLLLPHNGHLQIGGKLIYEAMFAVFGTNYFAFRVLEVLTVLLCVGLFFELMRRRVGTPFALLLSVLLAFLGAAWEPLLWPFDLHTTLSLAAGLGALLTLERGGRRADPIACLLLVVSVSLIEVGLAFLVGVAVVGADPARPCA